MFINLTEKPIIKPTGRSSSHIAKRMTDSINTKNRYPANSPIHHSPQVQYTASGAVDMSTAHQELTNFISTVVHLQGQSRSGSHLDTSTKQTYRLSEVATKTGFTAQYINNLIVRYKFIEPAKTNEVGGRESYEFSEEELVMIGRLKHLLVQGRPFREAIEFLKQDLQYQANAKLLVGSLQTWSAAPSPTSWRSLVERISAFPIFEAREKHVLLCIDGGRMTLAQCAVELHLAREDEVTSILNTAYAKLGRIFMYVLRLVMSEAI